MMRYFTILLFCFFCLYACKNKGKESKITTPNQQIKKDSIVNLSKKQKEKKERDTFLLNEKNAIPFLHKYAKKLQYNKVKITTSFGSFVIQLYDKTPIHKANFMYLTEKKYFNDTYFHRVVKDFVIQGGNTDHYSTARKRKAIGRYLLPPDTKKGYKHHRGTISMPSSNIKNPYKLASPYEFFIVVSKPGSYHLDKNYTPFGRVISGMDVVDKINKVKVDDGDWPYQNISMQVSVVK